MKESKRRIADNTDKREKEGRPLYRIFTAVPPSYDLINRVFTLRLDERWRKKASKACLADKPARIMDLCTGTGDLAVRLAKMSGGEVEITGYDYSQPMLDLAAVKSARAGQKQMPFEDGYFDAIGIAFAFRNLTYKNRDTDKFLKEIFRVLRPGGRFVIIESSQPRWKWLKLLFRIWTRYFVYPVGTLLSGNKPAYKYLAHSVIHYYTPDEICELLKGYGFREVNYTQLTGGVSALHVALK
jgi:demethylmenaquinone methyltransferase/2-methoxy-6-polyprenyl-1,4-benzoquinol methylase